jgi:integrase
MASTDRRPNGKWRARWREYPGGPQKTKQFDRKLDAQRFLAEIEHRSAIGTYVDPAAGRRPFGELAEAWAAVQDWKPSTRQGWGQTVRRLRSIWRLPLAEIDRLRLERLRAELAQHYSRRVTRNTMLRALAIARYAFECGLIGRDPTVGVDASPKRRADDARERLSDEDVPTRAEALAILRCAPSEYRAAVALGLAGLRIGEVLGMTAEAIDLAGRTVRIDQQAQPLPGRGTALTTPKAEKCRTIRVPELVAIELRRHLRTRASGLLYPGTSNGLLLRSTFYGAWAETLRAAGLEGRFKFHALRHFCASTLLAEGAPVTAVAGHLGDTVQTVSQVYAHWLRDDRDVPAAVLDRVLAPVATDVAVEGR